MKIYHNPRCSKSRQTLQLIQDEGKDVEVVEYLKDIPTEKELSEILKKLGLNAEDLIRKGEAIYKENFKGKELSDKEWIKAMVKHPKLIERPIVVEKDKAVLGRPPENVKDLF